MEHKALRIYSSASSLRHFRHFTQEAGRDLRRAGPTAVRFFHRTLIQRYRNSSFGLFWAVAPPLVVALAVMSGQKQFAAVPNSASPCAPAFFAVFGVIVLQSFLEALELQRSLFIRHQALLRRNNVPLEGLISASILVAGFSLLIRTPILALAFLYFGVVPLPTWPLAYLGYMGLILLGSGLGLMLAPLSSLRQDVEGFMSFFSWVLFAVTPVFIVPSPDSWLNSIYSLNPVAWVLLGIRRLAYGEAGAAWPGLVALPASLALLLVAWAISRVARPYVVERFFV